jgi:hypothetical protein
MQLHISFYLNENISARWQVDTFSQEVFRQCNCKYLKLLCLIYGVPKYLDLPCGIYPGFPMSTCHEAMLIDLEL